MARRTMAVLAALAFTRTEARGQEVVLGGRHFVARAHGTSDGLPQGTVTGLGFSRDGFLWVSTLGGLARYDGERFRVFNTANSPALASDWQLVRRTGRDGLVAVPIGGGMPARLVQGIPVPIPIPAPLPEALSGVLEEPDGTTWLSASTGVFQVRAGRVTAHLTRASGLPSDSARAAVRTPGGALIVATPRGLARVEGSAATPVRALGTLAGAAIEDLVARRAGGYWVATTAGIGILDGDTLLTPVPGIGTLRGALGLAEDPAGRLWMAMGEAGVAVWTGTALDRHRIADRATARTIAADPAGGIWIGLDDGGLVHWAPSRARTLPALSGIGLGPILQVRDGTVWVGAGKLQHIVGDAIRAFPEVTNVLSLYADTDGRLLAGALGALVVLDGERIVRRYRSSVIPRAILRDASGRLLVGGAPGLLTIDGDSLAPVIPAARALGLVGALVAGRNGVTWVGGTQGIGRLRGDSLRIWTKADGLGSAFVRDMHEAADGAVWIATYGGGLARLTGDRLMSVTTANGLREDAVSRVIEDGGMLWLAGNRGITRVSLAGLEAVLSGERTRVAVESFGRQEGLLREETTGGFQPAGWRLEDGSLWFPTTGGIARIAADPSATARGPLQVTGVLANGRPVESAGAALPGPGLRIPPGARDLEFQFAALRFDGSAHANYEVRLDGFDTDWVGVTDGSIRYPRLPPGRFTFRVRPTGTIPAGEASVVVTIPPAWHEWPGVRFLAGLALLVALAVAAQARVRRAERRLAREHELTARLREVDRLKDEFLANTSHELRTPLHGIIGLAEALANGSAGPLPGEAVASLGLVAMSGRRLNRLVSDILDLSRMRHRDLVLARQPVDLRATVDVVIGLSRPALGTRPLALVNAVPMPLPPVDADEDRLQQVLFNLVGNAIKFTPRGSVTVGATIDGDLVRVSVTDTGVGIDPADQERIFESFEQVDGSRGRPAEGAGLGLPLTRRLVELHGGQLGVESARGQGATFWFTLPVARQGAAQAPTGPRNATPPLGRPVIPDAPAAAPSGTADGPRGHVVVVEDDPVNTEVARQHLQGAGFSVTCFASGRDALRWLEAAPAPDLILLDVMMPEMSGFEVCRRVREHYGAESLPIVFLTARHQPADLVMGLESGANDFLGKPFGGSELVARVRTQVALQRAHRGLVQANEHLEARVEERTGQLARANHDLQVILNQLRTGVLTAARDRAITFASDAALRILGQDAAAVRGVDWIACLGVTGRDREVLETMVARPPHQRLRVPLRVSTGGNPCWLDVEVQDDPRDPDGRVILFHDISDVYRLPEASASASAHGLVGLGSAMQIVHRQLRDLAQVDVTVLIEGETGTGKELVAQAIHSLSARRAKPFIALNCAGLTESLLTSQLFGHRRGAFTGAAVDQAGVFEAANGGTLFLDEIADIPPAVQMALLRALQEREVVRLGETRPRRVDIRILAASNKDLAQRVASGAMRDDFLYRIRGARLHLPPLRERREDIPLLVSYFLSEVAIRAGRPVPAVSTDAMELLLDYAWPGNVRELRAAMEGAVAQSPSAILQARALPPEVVGMARPGRTPAREASVADGGSADDRAALIHALTVTGGNRAAAARALGISRPTLYRRMRLHGLLADDEA